MFSLNYPITLFPRQRTLCVVGRLGRKKKEGARGFRGGRLFPLPIIPSALAIFRLLLFLLGYQARASAEERTIYIRWRWKNYKFTMNASPWVICRISCSMERLGSLTLSSQLWRFKMLLRRKFNRVTITFTKTYFVCFFSTGHPDSQQPTESQIIEICMGIYLKIDKTVKTH